MSSFTPERVKQEKKSLSVEIEIFTSNIRKGFLNSEI